MSALTTAQTRMGTALARLELALRPVSAADSLADTDLRAECERLRRELAAANARVERLNAALSEVESRVGRAIDQVDALTGSKVVP
jgi:chromosome segregation ATPase